MKLLLAAAAAGLLLAAPAALAGGNSIVACDGSNVTTCHQVGADNPASDASGVYFEVTTGGGNRDYASVAVSCNDGAYATVLNVVVPAKGTGDSQTIYPPAGSCTASLEKQMSISKARSLATVAFEVTST